MSDDDDLLDLMARLRRDGRPYALATVVRTVAATSAKAGAKAVVTDDGEIHGWIGGGCARGAVKRAALEALKSGAARLISVLPQEELDAGGLASGETRESVQFHRSACPSGGSLDIFVEPMLPRPQLLVCGASPVARAIADLAARSGFAVTVAALAEDQAGFAAADRRIEGFALPPREAGDERIRIGMAHGRTFHVEGYQTNFPIDPEAAKKRGLDYLAQGGDADRAAARRGTGGGEDRTAARARRPRHRRHHAGGDRPVDHRRGGGAAPPRAARRRPRRCAGQQP